MCGRPPAGQLIGQGTDIGQEGVQAGVIEFFVIHEHEEHKDLRASLALVLEITGHRIAEHSPNHHLRGTRIDVNVDIQQPSPRGGDTPDNVRDRPRGSEPAPDRQGEGGVDQLAIALDAT
ncbi:MAG TPA: hypothetical protein VGD53_15155 [Actinoallomurus sp.]